MGADPADASLALAQRDLSQARVNRLAACFDLEQLGTPVVSHRDGYFFVIDGQHRIEALKLIGYGGRQVQCWTYAGLAKASEAAMFLELDDMLTLSAYPKFKVAVQAGHPEECDIDRIVRAQGLRISLEHSGGRSRRCTRCGGCTTAAGRAWPDAADRPGRLRRPRPGCSGDRRISLVATVTTTSWTMTRLPPPSGGPLAGSTGCSARRRACAGRPAAEGALRRRRRGRAGQPEAPRKKAPLVVEAAVTETRP